MEIVKIKIEDLKTYNKNAKVHTYEQIEQIKKSIEQFGMNDPLAVWGKDNLIVEGHGRLEALKELGYEEVDCIRLDHLTEEERKAYTLVHNKLTMNTDFDFAMLIKELEEIDEIDMEDFGFDFDIDEEIGLDEEEEENFVEKTEERRENILNTGIATFEGVGKYDIPQILPLREIPRVKEWVGFNYVLSDKNPKGKGVHFFLDDYQFERIWNNIDAYIEKLSQYEVVLSPDFSPYATMPSATQIFNHYRKHWVGRYLQEQGIKVIPTIRASADERSFEWYLDGEPKNSVVCISSMWATKTEEAKRIFLKEYNTMYDTLKPKLIYVYGKEIEGLRGNIQYIKTFAEKRWNREEEESNGEETI